MPIQLNTALISHFGQKVPDLSGFKTEPGLWTTSLRLKHTEGEGWKVEQLHLFQRIYYIAYRFFFHSNYSLSEENKNLLQTRSLFHGLSAKEGELSHQLLGIFELKVLHKETAEAPPKAVTASSTVVVNSAPRSLHELAEEQRKFIESCPVRGLPNLGNSCWLNTSCQILFRMEDFVLTLLKDPQQKMGGEAFEKREAVCEALRTLYLHYIDARTSSSVLREDMTQLRSVFFAFHKFNGSMYHQHDAAEGILNLIRAVMPGKDDSIGLEMGIGVEQGLANTLGGKNLWVHLANKLGPFIWPLDERVRDIQKEDENFEAYTALRQGRKSVEDERLAISGYRQEEEAEEDFALRKEVVVATRELYLQLKANNGIDRSSKGTFHVDPKVLVPLIQKLESALRKFKPDLVISHDGFKAIFSSVLEAFLPKKSRDHILEKQIEVANRILKEKEMPELTERQIGNYSLRDELEPPSIEKAIENDPLFLILSRQQVEFTHNGGFVADNTSEELREAPLEIDLSKLSLNGTGAKYFLVGIAEQVAASSVSGGHYIATLRHNGQSVVVSDNHIYSGDGFPGSHGCLVYKQEQDSSLSIDKSSIDLT